jgi:transcriptional regulator with GAF, ATPase, and Fis domain
VIDNGGALQELKERHAQLEMPVDYLCDEAEEVVPDDGVIGESGALRRVLRQVELVAATEASVLIQGESGTGKELFARAIHRRSPRASRALVKVNCASIPNAALLGMNPNTLTSRLRALGLRKTFVG